jgi:hypothetical protein
MPNRNPEHTRCIGKRVEIWARNRPASSVAEYDSVLARRTFSGCVTGDASSGTAASGDTYLMLGAGAIEETERRLAPRVVTTPREREVVDV